MKRFVELAVRDEPDRDADGNATEWVTRSSDEPKPRCGNCRWAVANPGDDGQEKETLELYPLKCARADEASDEREDAAPMGAWSEGGFRGDLLVSPDFGCVQWAAKDIPSPETK